MMESKEVVPVKFSAVLAFFKRFETEDRYKCLRLGQAFLVDFYPKVVDPDLFHAQNYFVARNKILQNYVEFDDE